MSKERGFSLLETLLAVVVVSIALSAMMHAFGVVIGSQQQLSEQALAQQVAWQSWMMLRGDPLAKDNRYKVTHAQQDWWVEVTLEETSFPGTHQARIAVQPVSVDDKGRQLVLSALLVKP